ncbi:MAG TPA: SRPBCC family protein [Pyrinomonadaceae bacterium]|nr:SRPBCC family protein [Pyrinomonadaceae bacterium]
MSKNNLKLEVLITALGGAAALAAYALFVRPWHLKWGATEEELKMPLPGDGIVENPKLNATHAITIHAPITEVWPWLVQVGQNRGGFYSYTWLENLVGCEMRNADQIVPEWQELKVGHEVWLHPKAPPLKVLAIEPGRAIVLENSWTFYLRPIDDQTTRLIIRGRGEFNPDLKNALLNFILWRGVFEPAHFIMERKMMLGIKQRAEASATMAI